LWFFSDTCPDSYPLQENTNAEGAEGQHGIDITPEECQALCSEDDECLAIDYDRSEKPWKDMRCWLHKTSYSTKPQANVDHYERVKPNADDYCGRKRSFFTTFYETKINPISNNFFNVFMVTLF